MESTVVEVDNGSYAYPEAKELVEHQQHELGNVLQASL